MVTLIIRGSDVVTKVAGNLTSQLFAIPPVAGAALTMTTSPSVYSPVGQPLVDADAVGTLPNPELTFNVSA